MQLREPGHALALKLRRRRQFQRETPRLSRWNKFQAGSNSVAGSPFATGTRIGSGRCGPRIGSQRWSLSTWVVFTGRYGNRIAESSPSQ